MSPVETRDPRSAPPVQSSFSVRHRRVVAYEPAWDNSGKARATVVIDYPDGGGAGEGTYWLPLKLVGGRRKRQREAERIARAAAEGIARQYSFERGLDPDGLFRR
jgi:hypothetical protein